MVSFSFIVCTEPYKYEAIESVLNLGEAIINKGHQILGIFLYGSGVYNIKKKTIKSTSDRNLSEILQNFCKRYNILLTACSTWISFTGINEQEFIEGAYREGLGGLSDLAARSDRVIFFGPGG
ncbi:MAG: DsrE/DsrF/TusD sulfur relay family protein [Candidatus Hermodarchaeota archaeon]